MVPHIFPKKGFQNFLPHDPPVQNNEGMFLKKLSIKFPTCVVPTMTTREESFIEYFWIRQVVIRAAVHCPILRQWFVGQGVFEKCLTALRSESSRYL